MNNEPTEAPTDQERIEKLKNIVIALVIVCLVLIGANVYQRTQVTACRNTVKNFFTEVGNIFNDENESFDSSKGSAQRCNSWPE